MDGNHSSEKTIAWLNQKGRKIKTEIREVHSQSMVILHFHVEQKLSLIFQITFHSVD